MCQHSGGFPEVCTLGSYFPPGQDTPKMNEKMCTQFLAHEWKAQKMVIIITCSFLDLFLKPTFNTFVTLKLPAELTLKQLKLLKRCRQAWHSLDLQCLQKPVLAVGPQPMTLLGDAGALERGDLWEVFRTREQGLEGEKEASSSASSSSSSFRFLACR